jgi:hypothetical protein
LTRPFAVGNHYAKMGGQIGAERQRHDRKLTRALVNESEQIDTSGPDRGRNGYTRIARRLIREPAERGNVEAAKLIWTRIEGLPRQDVDLTVKGEITKHVWVSMSLDQLSALYGESLRFPDSTVIEGLATEVPQIEPPQAQAAAIRKVMRNPKPNGVGEPRKRIRRR